MKDSLNNISANRNKELFADTCDYSKTIGDSNEISVISSYTEIDDIGVAEYINPKTNIVDIMITGKSVNDYVIAIRLYKFSYEGSKIIKYHTNRWTTKMANKSGDKVAFRTMLIEGEKLVSPGHEWTEKRNISLDGLKIYVNNLRRNYKILINSNGYVVTSNVELNGATMEKLTNIKDENDANAMYERRIGISQEEFDKIKEYFTSLMPEIEFLYNKKEGSIIIKLPVIVSTKTIENNER
jgi:hypothetical protein